MKEIIEKLKEREWQISLALLIQFILVQFNVVATTDDLQKIISAVVTVAVTVMFIWSRTSLKRTDLITGANVIISDINNGNVTGQVSNSILQKNTAAVNH